MTAARGAGAWARAVARGLRGVLLARGVPCAAGLIAALWAGPAAAATISGTVFEDLAGDLLPSGQVAGDSSNPGLPRLNVVVYDSNLIQQNTATTAHLGAIGTYSLTLTNPGTYYLRVQRPSTTAANVTGVVMEQSYGSAGSGNGGTAGGASGYGALCVQGTAPSAVDQVAEVRSNVAVQRTSGACFGGRRGAVSDFNGYSSTLTDTEHVIRVVVGTSDITGVDFGFSTRVVTNTNLSGQGSLQQAIVNANAVGGTDEKTLRFVPALATNASGTTGSGWWRISLGGTVLPALSANTVLDGRAFSHADGSTQLDTMPGNLEAATTVGAGDYQVALAAVARPELELNQSTGGSGSTVPVLTIGASPGASVRNLSLTGGSVGVLVGTSSTTINIEGNAIGWQPDGTAVRATNSLGAGIGVLLGGLGSTSCTAVSSVAGTVRGNAITSQAHGLANCVTGVTAGTLTFQNNVVRSMSSGAAFVLTPAVYRNSSVLNVENLRVLNNLMTGSANGISLYAPTGQGGGHVIQGNTVSGHTGAGIVFANSASGAMLGNVRLVGNTLSGNGAAGVSIFNGSSQMRQIEITQNAFSGNAGNAVDLNENGVTTVTGCPVDGFPTANGGLRRPVITSAARESNTSLLVSGTFCSTGTYRLEFYKATPATGDNGSDGAAAGEGSAYLGQLSGLSGGIFTNQSVAIPNGSLLVGEALTALAIRTDGASTAGNTSEFSANVVPTGSVIGKVFEDVAGNLLAGGEAVGDASNPGIPGVTVRLYNTAGTQLGADAITDANGNYLLPPASPGTYYVAVSAPARTAAGTTGVLLEQTYASAGTGHDGAAGGTTGYGSLCVAGTPPTYTDQDWQLANDTGANPANGACYGGRRGGRADASSATHENEHMVRVIVGAGNSVTGVNLGFSARVVTNTNVSGQGSLAQFIANANAVGGTATKTMRFVPAVVTNRGTSGSTTAAWWQISLGGSVLPTLSASNTVLDGRAWSLVDGSTLLDYMAGDLLSSRTVGTGAGLAGTRPAVPSPELEVNQVNSGVTANTAPVLSVGSSDGVQIKSLSITGGTNGVLVAQSNVTNLLIEGNVIGRQPSGTLVRASSTSPGAGNGVQFGSTDGSACTPVSGIRATVRGNSLSGVSQGAANCVNGLSVNDLVYEGNTFLDIGGSGLVLSPYAGAAVATQNLVVRNNSFYTVTNHGLRFFTLPGTGSGHQIIGNEFTDNPGSSLVFANATGVSSGSAATTTSSAVLVQGNTVNASGTAASSTGAGVQIANAASLQRIKVTQNQFSANAGPAIDLNGNFISTGTGCTADTGGLANGNLGRPVLGTVRRVGATSLAVTGSLCDNDGTYTLEFYKTSPTTGTTYLGMLEGLTAGSFTAQTVSTSEAVSAGDVISAIAIRTDAGASEGNTSEFSATTTVLPMGIAGVVFEDVAADLLADGAVGGTGNPGIPGVTVRLFRTGSGDAPVTSTTQVASTTTGPDGSYAFSDLADGTYYVAVQAPTRTAGSTAAGLLLEQTYGSAGTGNSATDGIPAGATYGSLCITGTAPGFTDRGVPTTSNGSIVRSNGACYGGRRGATADTTSTTPALDDLEHVVRVVLAADSVTGADFGFSARVVTNVNTSGQGSVRQLITNANAVGGTDTKTMRFVPAVNTNGGSTGAAWWQVDLAGTALPVLTASGTVLDGRAWNYVSPASQLTVYAGDLEPGLTVGTGSGLQATLAAVTRPALALTQPATGNADDTLPVLSVGSSNGVEILNLSIAGGTNGVLVGASGVTGLRIAGNAIGYLPSGTAQRAAAGASLGSAVQFGRVTSNTCTAVSGIRATVANNAMTGGTHAAVNCVTGLAVDDLVYDGNFMRGHAASGSAVVLSPHSGNAVATQNLKIRNNLITGAFSGLRFFVPAGGTAGGQQVVGNTFSAHRASAISLAGGSGGSALAGESLVQGNVITTSASAGVRIENVAALQRIRITQNSFSANTGTAIDLNTSGVSTGTGCNAGGGSANGNLGRPVIASAALVGTTQLRVSGSFCNDGTYTLEFYKATPGSGDTGGDNVAAGEGQTYLGAVTGQTGGSFTNQVFTIPTGALVAGDAITAIAIRTDAGSSQGNTSEFSANLTLAASLLLRATTSGGTGTFAFTVSNADTVLSTTATLEDSASVVVASAGVATAYDADTTVAGTQTIRLVNAGTAVAVSLAVTPGRLVTAANCTDGTSTFSAPGLPVAAGSTATVTIAATSVTAGSSWTCDFALQVGAPPQVTVRVVTQGGTGTLEFLGSNGLPTGSTGVSITTASAGVAADSAATVLTTSNAVTTVQQVAAAGWTLTTASCMDRNAASTGNPAQFGALSGSTVSIAASNVLLNADIVCTFSSDIRAARITGRVFRDTGSGGGTANDALQNGGEAGIGGATVRLTNCGSTVYATATTDGNGDYSLAVGSASGSVCVEQTGVAGHGSTGANVAGVPAPSGMAVVGSSATFTYFSATDRFLFTLAANASHAGLNFADVPASRLHADGARVALPGSTVQHPHTFVAGTAGTVSFTTVATQVPANPGWSQVLYRDTDCNAELDATGTVLLPATAVPVTEGQTVCVVLVQTVPPGAPGGASSQVAVTATLTLANTSPAQTVSATRTDLTTVSLSTLELAKRVRNVSQGTSFAVSNQARSGEVLEYQVTYRNNGAGPISTLVVRDSTPAYSTFVSAECGTPLPAGISTCVVSSSPSVEATGAIVWTFTGMLGGGLQGTVLFRVRVD